MPGKTTLSNGTGRHARPQYRQDVLTNVPLPNSPVVPLHGPNETPQVPITVPPELLGSSTTNPIIIANKLQAYIPAAQFAAIQAARSDRKQVQALLRLVIKQITDQVNASANGAAKKALQEAAANPAIAVDKYKEAAMRLKYQGAGAVPALPAIAMMSAAPQSLTLSSAADDERRGISRAPAGQATAPAPTVQAATPAPIPAPAAAPAKQSLVAAAKAVEERAQYVHVVFASSSQPLDESVARLNAAMLARNNLNVLLTQLEAMGYGADRIGSDLVRIRLGHITHATDAQLRRMAALGVDVDSNIGSNVVTKSIATVDEHPLLRQLYFGVRTMLGTDGPGVMGTSRVGEYAEAKKAIEPFCHGDKAILIDGRKVWYKELTPEQQGRFSVEYIQQMEDAYHAEVLKADAKDMARNKEQP